MDKNSKFEFNLDLLPYPVQVSIIQNLYVSCDDVDNLGKVFALVGEVADIRKTTWKFEKVFPLLVAFLPRNDTLKCRLVCHSWMRAIDNYFQNLGLAEPDYAKPVPFHANRDIDPLAIDLSSCCCLIESPTVLSSFMENMGTHPKNPFIARCVWINNSFEPGFWDEVEQFLERFGHYIWKLRLKCYCAHLRATKVTRDLLQFTPNLKILSHEFRFNDPGVLTAYERAQIVRDLKETPFPVLPNLTYLDWYFCTDFYNAALPQYSENLVHVRLWDGYFMRSYDSRAHGTFPSLKSLVVGLDSKEDFWKLKTMRSPLKTVTTLCTGRISMQEYFYVLHNFAETLESMNIEYQDIGFQAPRFQGGPFQSVELDFPQLKCIRFLCPDPLESFDALLNLKPGPTKLQIKTWLAFRHYYDNHLPLFQVMDGERIQIHGFLDRMHESKIWELMPRLETVDLNV